MIDSNEEKIQELEEDLEFSRSQIEYLGRHLDASNEMVRLERHRGWARTVFAYVLLGVPLFLIFSCAEIRPRHNDPTPDKKDGDHSKEKK